MEKPTAISIKGVSKKYQLGPSSGSFNEFVGGLFKRKSQAKQESDEFWALKDVTFDIKQGDVVGLIGRNGAGKSTLLKLLSKITPPSEGQIEINGRIASLLEVGTGFHPELTGKENIFLNGTILGMSREEVKSKYDEIVSFSGIERFLDTPVKRYSSGMYVRLAFAVAAHLDPEILIIDEVLAVGDAEFQKKCLGKMENISSSGRTVVFVSHNMGAVRELCNKGVYLSKGKVDFVGDIESVIQHYEQSFSQAISSSTSEVAKFDRDSSKQAQVLSVSVLNMDGQVASQVDVMDPFFVEYEVEIFDKVATLNVQLSIHRGFDCVFTTLDEDFEISVRKEKGRYKYKVEVPGFFLKAGSYTVDLIVNRPPEGEVYDLKEGVLKFEISEERHYHEHNGYLATRFGSVIFPGKMEVEYIG